MKASNFIVHVTLFIVAVIYAATFTIAKEVMPLYIGPAGFILLRIGGAMIFMALYHFLWVKEKVQSRKDYFLLALCAFFGVALNMVMFFEGLSRTSPIDAALIMVTTPLLVLVIGFFAATERLTLMKAGGIIVGSAGAMLLISDTSAGSNGSSVFGDMLVMVNAVSYAIYLVLVKPLIERYHAMTIMLWTFIFGFLFVLPFGWQEMAGARWADMALADWGAIVFVVFCTTFIAYTLNGWALRFVKPSIVGSYIYLQPLLGTIIAVMTGKYSLHLSQVLYALLIFGGVYMVSKKVAERQLKPGAA